jgi:cysteine-rich repeat protein
MARTLLAALFTVALSWTTASAICGDGVLEPGEQCDDGNTVGGDTCSETCQFLGCSLTGMWRVRSPGGELTCSLIEDADGTVAGACGAIPITGSRVGPTVTLYLAESLLMVGTMSECDSFGAYIPNASISVGFERLRHTVCGDGVVDPEEACDDGNFINGDTCTATCELPACGNAIVELGEQCDDGNTVNGDGCSITCEVNMCGNGVLEAGEECDDGNTTSGDGCSAHLCLVNVCGNGVLESGEQCDDGNTVGGDTCSETCQFLGCSLTGTWVATSSSDSAWSLIEDATGAISGVLASSNGVSVWALVGSRVGTSVALALGSAPLSLTMGGCDALVLTAPIGLHLVRQRSTVCGDGVVDPEEACDDGNFVNGDDCTVTCSTLVGCGNGTLDPGEECDDANGNNGDYCARNCKRNVCGDGYLHVGVETCDDGNTSGGDGCSADCLTMDAETISSPVGASNLSVTTDSEFGGDGATPSDPVETTVSAPVGTASGTLTITEQVAPPVASPGFIFMGTLVNVSADGLIPAPSAESPLTLTFRIDASVIPSGQNEGSIEIRRNGVVVDECAGVPGQAVPDPCMSYRGRAEDQDLILTALTSTLSAWDFLGGICGAFPTFDCRLASDGGAKFKMKSRYEGDLVSFKWNGAVATPLSLFGNPTDRNDYTLCVYDGRGLISQTTAPASSSCMASSCWKPTAQGYSYSDVSSDFGRITRLLLKAGDVERSRVKVKAQAGTTALPMVGRVWVQVRSKDGNCFGDTFGAPTRNDATGYKAQSN